MSLGAIGYVGFGKETTEGTTVAPTKYLPVTSFSFEDTNDYIIPDQIRGTRDRYVAMASPYMTSGSMELELIPNDIASLLKSALAAASVTSTAYSGGGYQHVFVPGNVSDTFTFESSAAGILVMRYGGIRVNTLEIAATFGEIVHSTWGLEGTVREKMGSETTESYTDIMPFHFSGASVKAAGVELATVKDFKFSIGNNLDRIGTLRRTRGWRRTALGMRDVGLAMTLDFTENTEYDRFLAETFFDIDIKLEGEAGVSGMGTNVPTLRIQIPKVRWNKVGIPLSAGDYLEQSVESLIIRSNSDNVVNVTLVNNEATVA